MLSFCSYIGLDWDNHQELEASYTANNKNNLIKKVNLENPKAVAK